MTPRRLTAVAAALLVAASPLLTPPAPAAAATVSAVTSWSAGTVAAGASKTYVWNNANSDIYQVTAAGIRTGTTTGACQMAVSGQAYSRTAAGARTFHLTVTNTDTVSCDATVHLALIAADASGTTGTLSPGQSVSLVWHNSNLAGLVYLSGVTPDVPAAGTCRMETTWKSRVTATGERQFGWTVRNTGSVTCSGQWRLGWLPVEDTTSFPASDPPNAPGVWRSLNSPVGSPYRVYVFGLVPRQTGAGACDWSPQHQRQSGNPSVPTPGAANDVKYVNSGTVPCALDAVTKTFIE